MTELGSGFPMSRPAISKHLRVLRRARLVRERRVARQRMYWLNPVPLQDVAEWVEAYRAFWQASLIQLKRHLEGDEA